MSSSPHALTLLREKPFFLLLLGRALSSIAYQTGAVCIGWQIYALTHSAYALGLAGLAQFIPMAVLTFAAGHAADRYPRQLVLQICQVAEAAAASFMAVFTFFHWLTVPEIFGAIIILSGARAFGTPASAAMLPGVVPEAYLSRATAVSSGTFQAATIVGPALGGFAYAAAPALPYAGMTVLWLAATVANGGIVLTRPVTARPAPTLGTLFAGATFVRQNPAILGALSLDLFAVLLGGASGLFPIFARDILHTGAWGVGLLRGAIAAGALLTTVILTGQHFTRGTGKRMFAGVIIFGLATIIFGVSRSLAVSLIALFIMGAADTVSVVIRMSLVQLRTPDDMRGRVSAINYLFINASNNLGDFESGIAAGLMGAVPATIIGGVGCILVALAWMKYFPALLQVDRLE
jgi:MFS family permease